MKTFKNVLDDDIELFLHRKAILFETRHWCSTYLLLTPYDCELDIKKQQFLDPGDFRIEGYFTLSNKAIHFNDDASIKEMISMFDGSEHVTEHCSAIMIGHLGKHIAGSKQSGAYISSLSSRDILEKAVSIVARINELVPVTNIILECRKDRPQVQEKYEDYGFQALQESDNLIMYLLKTTE